MYDLSDLVAIKSIPISDKIGGVSYIDATLSISEGDIAETMSEVYGMALTAEAVELASAWASSNKNNDLVI